LKNHDFCQPWFGEALLLTMRLCDICYIFKFWILLSTNVLDKCERVSQQFL